MNVYILGSGFSAEAGIPVTKQVIPKIFSATGKSAELTWVQQWLGQRLFSHRPMWWEHTSIEEVISRLDLFKLYSDDQQRQAEIAQVEETILVEFIDLLQPREYKIESTYLDFAKALQAEDTVVTFNYDLLVEHILKLSAVSFFAPYSFNQTSSRVKLLKLHGSLNMYFCRECGYVYTFPATIYRHPYHLPIAKGEICSQCHQDLCKSLAQVVVAPTLFKSYSIDLLQIWWYHAFKDLCQAQNIYFIGYSLPQADLLTKQLLFWAYKENSTLKKVYLISGPRNQGEELRRIYGALLENTSLSFGQWINASR